MNKLHEFPLVSIGIPTFNRPEMLEQALNSLITQNYRNLEIIISDNCSPDERVKHVLRIFQKKDNRIKVFFQPRNIGASRNFLFVLRKSIGTYFMWAADDDLWEPFYISGLVTKLQNSGDSFIAANYEAQYMDENGRRFEFFQEGKPFYSFQSSSEFERLQHALMHNYGNMVYSVYRKTFLDDNKIIFEKNEIPFILQIVKNGNWMVIPKIGFYKRTNKKTFRQSRWEKMGGINHTSLLLNPRKTAKVFRYHKDALCSIEKYLQSSGLEEKYKRDLIRLSQKQIKKHFLSQMIGYKKKVEI